MQLNLPLTLAHLNKDENLRVCLTKENGVYVVHPIMMIVYAHYLKRCSCAPNPLLFPNFCSDYVCAQACSNFGA